MFTLCICKLSENIISGISGFYYDKCGLLILNCFLSVIA